MCAQDTGKTHRLEMKKENHQQKRDLFLFMFRPHDAFRPAAVFADPISICIIPLKGAIFSRTEPHARGIHSNRKILLS